MTNREWVNSLTDEEFADWCCNEETVDWSTGLCYGITPKLRTIKMSYSSSEGGLRIWLKQERSELNVEASTEELTDEQILELQSSERDYCEMYEPTYNPEDGSM